MRLPLMLLLLVAGLSALGLAIPALGSAAAPPAVPVLSPLQSVGHLGVVTGRFIATGYLQDVLTVPAGYRVQAEIFWGSAGVVQVRDSGGNTFQIHGGYGYDGALDCHGWVLYPGDTLVASGSPGSAVLWKVVVLKF